MVIKIKGKILDACGFIYVWVNPRIISSEHLNNLLTVRLKDISIRFWMQQCTDCSKSCNYHFYKITFGTEKKISF